MGIDTSNWTKMDAKSFAKDHGIGQDHGGHGQMDPMEMLSQMDPLELVRNGAMWDILGQMADNGLLSLDKIDQSAAVDMVRSFQEFLPTIPEEILPVAERTSMETLLSLDPI
jgi:hypothetical protein